MLTYIHHGVNSGANRGEMAAKSEWEGQQRLQCSWEWPVLHMEDERVKKGPERELNTATRPWKIDVAHRLAALLKAETPHWNFVMRLSSFTLFSCGFLCFSLRFFLNVCELSLHCLPHHCDVYWKKQKKKDSLGWRMHTAQSNLVVFFNTANTHITVLWNI